MDALETVQVEPYNVYFKWCGHRSVYSLSVRSLLLQKSYCKPSLKSSCIYAKTVDNQLRNYIIITTMEREVARSKHMKPIVSCSQVFQTRFSFKCIIGFWTLKAMKDHEINNIIKIHIIDSADNEKSCCYQFLLTDRYNIDINEKVIFDNWSV